MAANNKQLGQVFTPVHIVHEMLDAVGYTVDKDLRGIRLLEPSFGEAIFLTEAVKRLIFSARLYGEEENNIPSLINERLWGVELDGNLHQVGLQNVINAAAELDVTVTEVNLHHMDAFDFLGRFDIVIGNPPYVRVHNLGEKARTRIETMQFGSGSTDLYVLFFELGLSWLTDKGQLIYITPNSFLRNTSQKAFRDYLIEKKLIVGVKDFGAKKIFPTASTYTAITHLMGGNMENSFTYSKDDGEDVFTTIVAFDSVIKNNLWSFQNKVNTAWLAKVAARNHPLKELGAAQNGLATLRDRVFIMSRKQALEWRLELDGLKPVVKASTYKGGDIDNVIIYPYAADRRLYTESELETLFPNIYAYLIESKEQLVARDIEKGGVWFQYGRSQGLAAMGKKKLVLSHVMKPKQNLIPVWELEENVLVYSGMFLLSQPFQQQKLQAILSSEDFAKYATLHGKDMSGGYRSFGTKTVNSFRWI